MTPRRAGLSLLLSLSSLLPLAAASVSIDPASRAVTVATDSLVVRLEPWAEGTLRVEAAPGKEIPAKKSLAVVAAPRADGWTAAEEADRVVLKGPRLQASVDKKSGLVSFLDASGAPLLEQKEWSFKPAKDPARNGLEIGASFIRGPGERYFGGGVIGDNFRQPSTEINLQNDYLQIHIPVLYSARGYGFFWDNASRGKLKMTADTLAWSASAGDLADFYVFAGPEADAVVAAYRSLTGAAPLFPHWAYGFWFSRNKFNSQQEILAAGKAFREQQFPVDMLVQDYFYWKPNNATVNWQNWGSHEFSADRYPDAKGMVAELHAQDHIHFMSVIWAKFDVENTAHGKELLDGNLLFPIHNDGFGKPLRYYDPYNADARKVYGRQVMDSLLALGVDAFWMDGAEPEMNMDTFASFDTGGVAVSRVMDAFPLMHTTAVYEAQRAATGDKRVVLLPRSAWAGEQRNGAAAWTSDIHQDWKTLAWQIEGLQNYSVAGLPYVTTDVGGYSPTAEADRELFVRWYQWGAFCPIFRVHGIGRPFPWEYGPQGEEILKAFDRLRYRLLPYIYSEAGGITRRNGTLLRPLVMDFRGDAKAVDTWDEFLFGPSLLVCPVYKSLRETAGTSAQWADLDNNPKGVTATYLVNGAGTPARHEMQGDLKIVQGNRDPASAARFEGTFTPQESGPLAIEVNEVHPDGFPVTVSVNGAPVPARPLDGAWHFPLFPFEAKKGELVRFSIEAKNLSPSLRVVRELPGPLKRDVYLPGKGDWYDFWTGERVSGGQTLTVETPLERIPLYVRAGAIVPFGPELQYADEKPADPIELRVYRGADGAFTFYEDEGDGYGYEKGACAEIPIAWNEAARTLTLGGRKGSYPGMPGKRTFRVVWVGPDHGAGEEIADRADAEVAYEGKAVTVSAKE